MTGDGLHRLKWRYSRAILTLDAGGALCPVLSPFAPQTLSLISTEYRSAVETDVRRWIEREKSDPLQQVERDEGGERVASLSPVNECCSRGREREGTKVCLRLPARRLLCCQLKSRKGRGR